MRVPFPKLYLLWLVLGLLVPLSIYVVYFTNKFGNASPSFYSNPTYYNQRRTQAVLEATCKRYDLHREPLRGRKPYMIVDDAHRTIYCSIPKIACTNWKRILLYINGHVNVTKPDDIRADDAHHKYSYFYKYLSSYSKPEAQYRIDNYFKFMIVRDPFERVLSAYRNKFRNTKSAYFQKTYGRVMVKRYRKNVNLSTNTGKDVSFAEFVQYLIDPRTVFKEPLNEHWIQQYKLCRPCNIKYDYIGRYETLIQDAKYIFSKMGIKEELKFPNARKSNKSKALSTADLYNTFYDKVPVGLLKSLYNLYRMDYKLFDFKYPSVLTNNNHIKPIRLLD